VTADTRQAVDGCNGQCTVSGSIPGERSCSDDDDNGSGSECMAWKAAGYCDASDYKWYMSTMCAMTCGVCTAPPGTTPAPVACTDQFPDECAQWQSFCTHADWGAWMRSECPVTCGSCAATGSEQLAALMQ
jgi:hypothetical protein